jgi:hypothetical protein
MLDVQYGDMSMIAVEVVGSWVALAEAIDERCFSH